MPVLTVSRVGDIPIAEIDAVMTASVAALQEAALLGTKLARPLLELGLSVYHVDSEALQRVKPDVILTCLQTAHGSILKDELLNAALLSVLGYAPRVVHLMAETVEGSLEDMQIVADALHCSDSGRQLVNSHREQLDAAAEVCKGRSTQRVACFQWPHPLMASGAWVPHLIGMAGGVNALTPNSIVSQDSLAEANPDIIIFGLCGMKLKPSLHAAKMALQKLGDAWHEVPAAQHRRIAVVDGERIFSRPGPLLTQSLGALVEILHSECQPFGYEGTLWAWL